MHSGRHLLWVRFLVDEPFKRYGRVFNPWALYRLPGKYLQGVEAQWEEVPHDKLRVGRRLRALIAAMSIVLPKHGCCGGCSDMEGLLNHASLEWIRAHRGEIVQQIEYNAKQKDVRVPKWMIKAALQMAITLEQAKAGDK